MKTNEIFTAEQLINRINTTNLPTASILKLVKLSKEVKSVNEDYMDAERKIITDYKVEPNKQGICDWSGHEKEAEINKKIQELRTQEVDLKNANFMSEDELMQSVKGFSIGQILIVEKLLIE